MANKASALKYIRKTRTRTIANRQVNSRLKTLAKTVEVAKAGEDKEATKNAAIAYVSALDKAAKRGIIHRNRANRHKASVSSLIFA